MKKMLIQLAKKNNLSNDLYNQEVRKDVKQIYSPDDEIAILRKEVSFLRSEIERITGRKLIDSEFIEYHLQVESIKNKRKEEIIST